MRGVLLVLLSACTARDGVATIESDLAGSCREVALPWGADGAGLRPAAEDSRAWGPQGLAMAGGDVLVLDAYNRRILRIHGGEIRIAASNIARDAEDLTVGPDGAFAVWSPLQARAWIFEPTGEPAGEVAIDRAFRHVTGISLASSRRLVLHTAYQETMVAGSPAAPLDLATTLTGKREGAALLADGRGIATRATGGVAQLLVVDNPPGRRSSIRRAFSIPGRVDAAAVIGAADNVACARTEQIDDGGAVRVQRRAVCLALDTGRVVLDLALPSPGTYLPRRELALGDGQLAMLHATAGGLVVRTCEVGR